MTGCLVIKGALEKALDDVAPEDLTGQTFRDYGLDRLNNLDMMGLSFNISYRPGNDNPGPNHDRAFEAKGGKLVPAADWVQFTKIKPKPPKK